MWTVVEFLYIITYYVLVLHTSKGNYENEFYENKSFTCSQESSIRGQFSSITSSTETGCKPCFSFAQKPSETSGLQKDIQQYIKKFKKNVSKLSTPGSNFCDLSEYSYQSSSESLLIDRVLLKNRIESGSVLLCGVGNILSCKSFVG